MTRNRSSRIFVALFIAVLLLVPATSAFAQAPVPVPVVGPRLAPPAIPHSDVIDPYTIYNENLVANLPVQSLEADLADGGNAQEDPGRGIKQTATEFGFGIQLYDTPMVCNDFNAEDMWPSTVAQTDVWTDWFSGWAPFAIDEGNYQAKNTTFSREKVVGPGNVYGDDQSSVKIASNQPYAGGFGSPAFNVPAGYADGKVVVTVSYLIWDHDTGGGWDDGMDYDWASLGIKTDVVNGTASYVNGYVRGEWAEMSHVVDVNGASDVMVLLQGQSPGAFNSNIYFDNVRIAFVDSANSAAYLTDCTLDEE